MAPMWRQQLDFHWCATPSDCGLWLATDDPLSFIRKRGPGNSKQNCGATMWRKCF